jgi:transcriptional regulator with XRE-family HTH domain
MRSPIHKSPDRIRRGWALAAALRAARQHAGLTQRVLAARMARAQSFVAKVEGGSLQLKAWELLDYADALRVDPADLLRRVATLASASQEAKRLDPNKASAAR